MLHEPNALVRCVLSFREMRMDMCDERCGIRKNRLKNTTICKKKHFLIGSHRQDLEINGRDTE